MLLRRPYIQKQMGAGGSNTPLFDRVAAEVATGHSLRKLSSTYSGPVIRVMRSSDQTEQDIGFDGAAIDTVALLAFAGSADAHLVKWYDQGVGGHHVIPFDAQYLYQIVRAGVLVTDDKGRVALDGGTFVSGGHDVGLTAPNIGAFQADLHVFAVVDTTDNKEEGVRFFYRHIDYPDSGFEISSIYGDDGFDIRIGNGFAWKVQNFTPLPNRQVLFDAGLDTKGDGAIYYDGALIEAGALPIKDQNTTSALQIGRRIDNHLSEIIGFREKPSQEEVDLIRQDIAAAYPITLT